jgi:hypothetical protein
MGSIETKFAEGETCWWVGPDYKRKIVTCPECAGTKETTVILGNGEEYAIDCDRCAPGFEPARGTVECTVRHYEPQKITLGPVEITHYHGEPRVRYGNVDESKLFVHPSDCQKLCDEMNVELAEQDERMWDHARKEARRKQAFSVSYWRRQKRDLLKDLKRIDARLRTFQKGGAA